MLCCGDTSHLPPNRHDCHDVLRETGDAAIHARIRFRPRRARNLVIYSTPYLGSMKIFVLDAVLCE